MSAEIKNLSPQPVWGYFYDLTQIPRPTGHMEAVTRFMVAFGKGLGLETLQDEVGNVLIRKPASPGMEGHKTVTMQSHLDMVPQKNSSVKHDFLTDPIDAYIDGDWVKARETTLGADNGMGAAFAMAVLADKTLMHGPLEALFTINEEVGMDGAVGLKPGFLKGEILLNCDSEEEGELFVGCAGGADLNVSMQFKEDTYIPEGDVAVKISLTGLKGGHSGVDIHLGRANANKLMFRFLKEAVRDYGARLSSVDGGSLRNAIPREAFAVITIPGDNVEALWELVSDYREMYRYEYKGIEHNINFTAEMTDMPARFFVTEIIREKILLYYDKEIPYSVEVVVEEFKEEPKKIHIRAVINVERDSQKGIIIGKQGKALKKVATEARRELERFFGKTIFLETYVKVDKDWRSSDKELRNFGYQLD